jgi:hypothetical protein
MVSMTSIVGKAAAGTLSQCSPHAKHCQSKGDSTGHLAKMRRTFSKMPSASM